MNHPYAVTRLILLMVVSLLVIIPRLLIWPVFLVSRRADRWLRRGLLRLWARCFARVAGMRTVCLGPLPKPPFYLVMNHVSYLDMLILARQTGCIFVSRGDVEHWPVFGTIAKSLHIIFIDRAKRRDTARVNDLIREAIQEGDGIAVFPEGRVSCGADVEEFKSALLQPPVSLGIPVHYATICYRTPDGGPNEGALVSWWRPEPFYTHLYRFLRHDGATATIHFGEQPLSGDDRKILAKQLHSAVRANFVPLRQAVESIADAQFPIKLPDPPKPEPKKTE